MKIKTKIQKLFKKRGIIDQQIRDIQNGECSHVALVAKYGADTGNYDPSADCYWIDVDCEDCGWRAHFDSERDKEKYRYYGDFVKKESWQ